MMTDTRCFWRGVMLKYDPLTRFLRKQILNKTGSFIYVKRVGPSVGIDC